MKPIIKVKLEEILKLQEREGMNDSELAYKLLINPSQVGRIKKGKTKPGEDFIARLLSAYPDKKFEDFFFLDKPLHQSQDKQIAAFDEQKAS